MKKMSPLEELQNYLPEHKEAWRQAARNGELMSQQISNHANVVRTCASGQQDPLSTEIQNGRNTPRPA